MLKKSFLLTFLSVLSFCLIQAQVPSLLNYQAVARNSVGTPLANQAMQVRLSILQGSASGSSVYSEVRAVTTNAVGLFVIQIGSGGALSTSGNLASVNWTNGSKFLKVEIDPLGGSSFIELGTNQLVSVPYALSAAPSGAAGGDLSGNYPNPTLANNSVTTQKIADLSVTFMKLSDQAVTTAKLADGSVTDVKIQSVSGSKVTGNIAGNAATATTAGNITATANTTLTSLSNLATVGTITSGVWSGTAVAVEKGGTGATTASAARTNLGLGNVDNTSDANKPVSAATQTALDLKAPLASPTLTGTPLAPTATAGTNTTQIATTAFVTGAINTANAVVVPYTGATQAVDLGAHNLTVNGVSVGIGSGAILSNTAIGGSALSKNTTGSDNTANGVFALVNNTTGSNNTANGIYALEMNTSGSNNTSNGMYALSSNTTGDYNTSSGLHALSVNTTGSYNTAIGFNANVATGALTNATAIGHGANVATSNTIQLGNTSITNVKTSGTITADAVTYPKAHGTNGQVLSTTGSGTLAWITPSTTATAYSGVLPIANGGTGASSQNFVDLNSEQTIAGTKTFNKDIVVNSVMIGKGGSTLADNIAIGNGARSGNINTGGNANIAIGTDAQKNNTGFYNVSIGNANLVNGSGDENTAIGYGVMSNNTTGIRNTGVGLFTFYQNTTGGYNTAIGHGSLGVNTTGSYNTALGTSADVATNNLTNATAIGYGASVDASNSIQLGNTAVTNVKTSGTITAGTVTYPNAHNSTEGQVLTTDASGVASWATPASSSSPTYTIGLNVDLGGYVFLLSSDSKHGLVAETQDQSSTLSSWYDAQDNISNQANHSTNGKKFTDWRLPTKHELNLMYIARTSIGGFATSLYWSSTENDPSSAWYQNFNGGLQTNTRKYNTYYVRAVRAF